mmetsp:Transcript_50497/g.159821  ORF Transcript_50497/g.159821 Transcript_50497/m.159821 type:complete len:463 (-) Transcript_50497:645-2033(-)
MTGGEASASPPRKCLISATSCTPAASSSSTASPGSLRDPAHVSRSRRSAASSSSCRNDGSRCERRRFESTGPGRRCEIAPTASFGRGATRSDALRSRTLPTLPPTLPTLRIHPISPGRSSASASPSLLSLSLLWLLSPSLLSLLSPAPLPALASLRMSSFRSSFSCSDATPRPARNPGADALPAEASPPPPSAPGKGRRPGALELRRFARVSRSSCSLSRGVSAPEAATRPVLVAGALRPRARASRSATRSDDGVASVSEKTTSPDAAPADSTGAASAGAASAGAAAAANASGPASSASSSVSSAPSVASAALARRLASAALPRQLASAALARRLATLALANRAAMARSLASSAAVGSATTATSGSAASAAAASATAPSAPPASAGAALAAAAASVNAAADAASAATLCFASLAAIARSLRLFTLAARSGGNTANAANSSALGDGIAWSSLWVTRPSASASA